MADSLAYRVKNDRVILVVNNNTLRIRWILKLSFIDCLCGFFYGRKHVHWSQVENSDCLEIVLFDYKQTAVLVEFEVVDIGSAK